MKKKVHVKRKESGTSKIYAYLIVVALVVVATFIAYGISYYQQQSVINQNVLVYRHVDANMVCMVNDAFMGKPQIPVPVNGRTYYGCCQGCVDKLSKLENIRMAIDPFNGTQIDKSEAYIVVTDPNGSVSYFQSVSNFEAFKQKIKL